MPLAFSMPRMKGSLLREICLDKGFHAEKPMSAVRGEYQPCAGDEHHQVIPLAASSALSHLWTQCSGYSWQCHSTVQKGHLSSVREIWRGEIPALPPTLLCRCPQLTVLSVIKQNQTCHQTLCKPLQVWGCACVLDLITSLCFIFFFITEFLLNSTGSHPLTFPC